MLDPAFITKNREKTLIEMKKREVEDIYLDFIRLYEKLAKEKHITPSKLMKLARKVTLKDLNCGIEAKDSLMILINQYLRFPNFCDPSVPIGKDKEGDVIVYSSRNLVPKYTKIPETYDVLGKKLGIFNQKANLKVAGEGFPFLFGVGASLDRALINFMVDTHRKNGYKEVLAPTLVNERSMFTTGAFPFYGDRSYLIEGTDLYLNPTIEVQETNLLRNVSFGTRLKSPLRLVGYSRSFRIEDKPMTAYTTLHEFGKVEIFVATRHEDWKRDYARALKSVEEVLEKLELPYRKVLLCTGSMGQGYHLTYDYEVFAPGSNEWWEVASCASNSDFSSRRMNATYLDDFGKQRFIHTLHVTAVSIPRVLSAILENNQLENGNVRVPVALRPFMENLKEITRSSQPSIVI